MTPKQGELKRGGTSLFFRALKRDGVPLTNPSPSPLKERGTQGVR